MRIIGRIDEMRRTVSELKSRNLSVGFVPTMGYIHDGHLALVRRARDENDFVIMSIFVNPIQFGMNEDYDRYPRDLKRDIEIASSEGVDLLFTPSRDEMYPNGFRTYVEVEGWGERLCGLSRPGHFRGVTTVVAKLFMLVEPDRAYFGTKDIQQLLIVRRMVRDMNMKVQIVPVPTVRESDGLAMSSRNVYLSQSERLAARVLYRSLTEAEKMFIAGERNADEIRRKMVSIINTEPLARIDYVSVFDPETLDELKYIEDNAYAAVAVWIGETRLIDNLPLEVKSCCGA